VGRSLFGFWPFGLLEFTRRALSSPLAFTPDKSEIGFARLLFAGMGL
jgi:hypothetical protein